MTTEHWCQRLYNAPKDNLLSMFVVNSMNRRKTTLFEKVGRNMYQSSGWSPWIDLLSTNGWLLSTNGRAASKNTALSRQKLDCVVRTFSSDEAIISLLYESGHLHPNQPPRTCMEWSSSNLERKGLGYGPGTIMR